MTTKTFLSDFTLWAFEQGFALELSREYDTNQMYYFKKGKYRFVIKLNWDKEYKHSSYGQIDISLLDCKKEKYYDGSGGYLGWVGREEIQRFKKPISRMLFDSLCEHYEFASIK